ncbi:hypothetical protein [Botrimarina sp.]|uniref:hypothetical protein n=1 Tax=Botrimarina sp. TaxID=2795802 RepID=UPI0032EE5C7C
MEDPLLNPAGPDWPGPPRVLWVGRPTGPEFGPCLRLVSDHAHVRCVDRPDDALGRLAEPHAWDLTVLACPTPLDDAAAASRLAAAAPGRFVQLLGAWCEGEGRTGRTAEGAERVFWHAWPLWWRNRWRSPAADQGPGRTSFCVVSRDPELAAGVGWALAAEGFVVAAGEQEADLLLLDAIQLGGREADRLAAVCRAARRRGAQVILMVDFPRAEIVAAARRIGAAAVVGKPVDAGLLAQAARAAIVRPGRGPRFADATTLVPLRAVA